MPYKDPERRREHDRERRRRERAGALVKVEGTQKKLSALTLPERPSVADVAGAVVEQINLVKQAPVETLARARTIGYLAGVLLKALEIGEIEKRLTVLELRITPKE